MSQFDLCFNTQNRTNLPFNDDELEQLRRFRIDNPHIIGNFIPKGMPFILRDAQSANMSDYRRSRPDIACALDQAMKWTNQTKRNVTNMVEGFGDENLLAIAALYNAEIVPYVDKTRALTELKVKGKNFDSITSIGAAATALESSQTRLSSFGEAIHKYQTTLLKIQHAAKTKQPKLELIKLGQIAKQQHLDLNTKFQAELVKFKGKVKASGRGNIWSSSQRGINIAKSARNAAPLQLTSMAGIRHLKSLEVGANILGKGVIALDAGIRMDNVYKDYQAGKDWQRRAVVETTGFGAGTAAGAVVGGFAVKAGVGIAIAVGPVGWVILIGVGLGVGYGASKAGDEAGKLLSGLAYDTSSNINWF